MRQWLHSNSTAPCCPEEHVEHSVPGCSAAQRRSDIVLVCLTAETRSPRARCLPIARTNIPACSARSHRRRPAWQRTSRSPPRSCPWARRSPQRGSARSHHSRTRGLEVPCTKCKALSPEQLVFLAGLCSASQTWRNAAGATAHACAALCLLAFCWLQKQPQVHDVRPVPGAWGPAPG